MVIETRRLCKDYRLGSSVIHALVDVDVQIAPGEFVAVMGPSGSGKSTFMNVLGLLDRPTSGEYRLESRAVNDLSDHELAEARNSMIGFVFQTFNLLPRKTALQNIALPLLYSPGVGERDARAWRAIESVGLAERAHHRPAEMSGGQQQRVAIARAMVNNPPLLLADEPTGNLDSATGADIMAVFKRINEAGQTIVLVTHEEEIAGYAHRTLRFRDGRIVSDQRA